MYNYEECSVCQQKMRNFKIRRVQAQKRQFILMMVTLLIVFGYLIWQWVVFGLRLGWVHTLRYISYASLYDRFSYSSLCRSSHFVQPLRVYSLQSNQPPPSNTIDFGVDYGVGLWVKCWHRSLRSSRNGFACDSGFWSALSCAGCSPTRFLLLF